MKFNIYSQSKSILRLDCIPSGIKFPTEALPKNKNSLNSMKILTSSNNTTPETHQNEEKKGKGVPK